MAQQSVPIVPFLDSKEISDDVPHDENYTANNFFRKWMPKRVEVIEEGRQPNRVINAEIKDDPGNSGDLAHRHGHKGPPECRVSLEPNSRGEPVVVSVDVRPKTPASGSVAANCHIHSATATPTTDHATPGSSGQPPTHGVPPTVRGSVSSQSPGPDQNHLEHMTCIKTATHAASALAANLGGHNTSGVTLFPGVNTTPGVAAASPGVAPQVTLARIHDLLRLEARCAEGVPLTGVGKATPQQPRCVCGGHVQKAATRPLNYVAWAVGMSLFMPPLGVPALVYAIKSFLAHKAGRQADAFNANRLAYRLLMTGFVTLVVALAAASLMLFFLNGGAASWSVTTSSPSDQFRHTGRIPQRNSDLACLREQERIVANSTLIQTSDNLPWFMREDFNSTSYRKLGPSAGRSTQKRAGAPVFRTYS